MSSKNIKNSDEKNFVAQEDDFKLCQENKKIYDEKFETKPTTFFKDALKRFRKNKSSVIAAYIIGLLLLLSFAVPIFSPFDVDGTHPEQKLLYPKIFKSGTGFWDGTKKYNNIVYDKLNERVTGDFQDFAIFNLTVNEEKNLISVPTIGAYGGSYKIIAEPTIEESIKFSKTYEKLTFTLADNYKIKIKMGNTDDLEGKLGSYTINLKYLENHIEKTIVLKDWSNDYSEYTLDISNALAQNSLNIVTNASIEFNVKSQADIFSYILVDELEFQTTSPDQTIKNKLKDMSILDANNKVLLQKNNAGIFPSGYWQSNAKIGVKDANIYYCTFHYDEYALNFGPKTFTVDQNSMQSYIDKGWCEYDFKIGAKSFKKLNDRCPVNEVLSQTEIPWEDEILYDVTGNVTMYKYLGYDSMPKFIFGTDQAGKDLFTLAFSGLKLSLLIAVIASAICFLFGLVWGSVSGYFGGNIDLYMERFCDILGGVPWIVIMTLAILLLGNNVVTFTIALCLTGWMGIARRTRTQFYRFKGREYVLASRTLGASDKRLIFRHILPNSMGTIVTSSVLMIPGVIFSEATLSYLGLGLQGENSFGVILSKNQQFLASYPMLIVFPAIIISLIMISFNLFGNGLRDALNPSLKGSE